MLVAGAADLFAGCSEMRRLSAGDEHENKTSAPRPSARHQKSTYQFQDCVVGNIMRAKTLRLASSI
jgi:hypothetical protein